VLVCSLKVILPGPESCFHGPFARACRRGLRPTRQTRPGTANMGTTCGTLPVSVTCMTPSRYRRPLMICAAVVAILSLGAVGTVMALAFAGTAAPVWVTSTALYGLPVAFLLMLFLVLDSVAGRRRAGKSGGL